MHLRNHENFKKMKHKSFILGGFCPGGFCLGGLSGGFMSGGVRLGGFVLEPLRQIIPTHVVIFFSFFTESL